MESLSETTWDVVIAGTGLSQSLLALALSRSGKKVLHVDKNDYYGSADAALSLQEAESWVKGVNSESNPSLFENASITHSPQSSSELDQPPSDPRLGFSRAYSLSLSPQLIYTRSSLLPALVSSKVYRQLEFLAVGSWWIFESTASITASGSGTAARRGDDFLGSGRLSRIPGGREDVFADKTIDLKSKRSLMKFLKLVTNEEELVTIMEEWGERSLTDFLTSYCNIVPRLQPPLVALTLSPEPPESTPTSYALPRIRRHLTSIGVFGPGFGSVVPKWGGMAEIAQVACRAGAVGGGVYILNNGMDGLDVLNMEHPDDASGYVDDAAAPLKVHLHSGEDIQAKTIVGSHQDLPPPFRLSEKRFRGNAVTASVSIVSSPLKTLFPFLAEGAPPPAVAVVCFPNGALSPPSASTAESHPVYIMVHSSDTGECPTGQCVLYASIRATGAAGEYLYHVLDSAVQTLLRSLQDEPSTPEVLWTLQYTRLAVSKPEKNVSLDGGSKGNVLRFSDSKLDLAIDDGMLEDVRAVWQKITGETDGFMMFEERGESGEDDGEEV